MIAKLRRALYGVGPSEITPQAKHLTKYVSEATEPPAYLVRLVLSAIVGEILPWDRDVSAGVHEVPIAFADQDWLVTIRKGYWWYLAGPAGFQTVAQRLQRKINASAALINKALAALAKKRVQREEFFVFNTHERTRFYYDHFKELTERALRSRRTKRRLKKFDETDGSIEAFLEIVNLSHADDRELDAYCAATAMFFFALTELIFDAAFTFTTRKGLTYREFRAHDWSDRCKFTLDMGSPNMQTAFAKVKSVRERHRNVLAHAAPLFVVVDETLRAMIPIDASEMADPRWNSFYAFSRDEARQTLATFNEFLSCISADAIGELSVAFLETNLPIMVHEGALRGLWRRHGNSREALLAALRDGDPYAA